MSNEKKTVEISVVQWRDGSREVALRFFDFDQMFTISADSARQLAFCLMECSDCIEPPFAEKVSEATSILGAFTMPDIDDEA